ncbi:MAG: hypothetical protein WA108_09440 [Thiobacillus sp.]
MNTRDDGQRGRAVDDRRLFQLLWQLAHEGRQHPDRERQCEDQVGERQRQQIVVQPERADQLEHAGQHRDLRKHRYAEDHEQQQPAAAKPHAADRVGGGQRQRQR